MDPSTERTATFKRAQATPRLDKRLLNAIFRDIVMPCHAQTQTHDLAAMKAVKTLKRLCVAAARGSDQQAVGRPRSSGSGTFGG
jgi:hypothetical protein